MQLHGVMPGTRPLQVQCGNTPGDVQLPCLPDSGNPEVCRCQEKWIVVDKDTIDRRHGRMSGLLLHNVRAEAHGSNVGTPAGTLSMISARSCTLLYCFHRVSTCTCQGWLLGWTVPSSGRPVIPKATAWNRAAVPTAAMLYTGVETMDCSVMASWLHKGAAACMELLSGCLRVARCPCTVFWDVFAQSPERHADNVEVKLLQSIS